MTTQTEKPRSDGGSGPNDIDPDIQGLSELASLVTAAQDALSDEMVSRMASAFSEGITLLDRVTRNDGLMRLVHVLDRPENQALLLGLADALSATSRELASSKPSKGGVGGMLKLARDPGTEEGLRMLSLFGKHLSESMRARKVDK